MRSVSDILLHTTEQSNRIGKPPDALVNLLDEGFLRVQSLSATRTLTFKTPTNSRFAPLVDYEARYGVA
jgi:hypothetical protein